MKVIAVFFNAIERLNAVRWRIKKTWAPLIFKIFSPSLGRLIGGFYGGPVEAVVLSVEAVVEKLTNSACR